MLLGRSTSLPHIQPNYSKFDQFFTQKTHAKELAMEQDHPESHNPESQPISYSSHPAHSRNLQFIQQKGTLRNKVDSYLTNSSKLGILDHTRHQIHNRKSLTKVSVEQVKPVKTQLEQQISYLNKIKTQLNFYSEKNRRTENSIKKTQAMMNEIKEKIVFYEQQLSRSWADRAQLLKQREENIVYIQYQADRLRYMKQRLKSINLCMKVKARESQKKLKQVELEFKRIVEAQCNQQAELDHKKYLLQKYENYQQKQSEQVVIETSLAMRSLQEQQAAEILKQHQSRITIMEPIDYHNEVCTKNHQRLMKEMVFHKFFAKMLSAIASKYSSYYESYEKAEQMIKMHCLDRDALVQDSYRKSFEVKSELEAKIIEKQQILKQLEQHNKTLQQNYEQLGFKQEEQTEKRLDSLLIQYRTGKKLVKQAKNKELQEFKKNCSLRLDEVDRCKSMLLRMKQWVVRHKQSLGLSISKNLSLQDHFRKIIQFISSQLKSRQQSFCLKQLTPNQGKGISNKKGTIKKKK